MYREERVCKVRGQAELGLPHGRGSILRLGAQGRFPEAVGLDMERERWIRFYQLEMAEGSQVGAGSGGSLSYRLEVPTGPKWFPFPWKH